MEAGSEYHSSNLFSELTNVLLMMYFVIFQRGKPFPALNYLVKVNTPRAVMNETKKAFKKLPNLEQALTALNNLKGVGTTMASGNLFLFKLLEILSVVFE